MKAIVPILSTPEISPGTIIDSLILDTASRNAAGYWADIHVIVDLP